MHPHLMQPRMHAHPKLRGPQGSDPKGRGSGRGSVLGTHAPAPVSFGRPVAFKRGVSLSPLSVGALSIGAFATGALAMGAVAVGALAVGRLNIGHSTIKDLHVGKLQVDDLVIGRRTVTAGDPPAGQT